MDEAGRDTLGHEILVDDGVDLAHWNLLTFAVMGGGVTRPLEVGAVVTQLFDNPEAMDLLFDLNGTIGPLNLEHKLLLERRPRLDLHADAMVRGDLARILGHATVGL
jgi:hypothetical protein